MDSATTEAASGIVDSVHFSFYTPEEVQRISVKKITKANLLDAKDTPIPDGLYDPALGPINDTDLCKSCGQVSFRCPGHCGHIDFAKPLYNPLLFKALQNLLQITCFYCYKFRLMETKVKLYIEQLDLIAKGDIAGAKSIARSIEASEIIVSEESAESVTSSVEITESKANSWVSIQHCEALSVLSKFMKERRKKCDNCGRKCPTITSPLFGWFNKGTQASDIRTDYLLDSSVVLSSSDTKNSTVTQLRGESASEMDEELSTPKNRAKESKKLGHLPPEFIKQMASASQKHLLPSEVESILEKLWENEAKLCQLISDIQCKSSSLAGSNKGYAMFFLKALLVPPSKFRPAGTNSDREERGEIFFFYRPKVNKEEAHSPDDVQRLYIVLRPESGDRSVEVKQSPDSGKEGKMRLKGEENKKDAGKELGSTSSKDDDSNEGEEGKERKEGGHGSEEVDIEKRPLIRFIVMGKKSLPDPRQRSRPFWGFVELVTTEVEDIKKTLRGEEYDTATRGHRFKPPARALAEGVYRILRHESDRRTHTHLIYKLEFPPPDAENEPQESLNVEREASYLIQIKNPEQDGGGGSGGFGGLPSKRRASFPAHLHGRFGKRRFHPADPPDFLNYEGCELLLIAASDDVEEELGLELKTECEADAKCSDLLRVFGETASPKPLLSGTWV